MAESRDSLFEAPLMAEQERMIEAILFATADPMTLPQLAGRMPHGCDPATALALVRKRYEGRGVTLVRIAEAWAFHTANFISLQRAPRSRKFAVSPSVAARSIS